jgi:hypothetical protein
MLSIELLLIAAVAFSAPALTQSTPFYWQDAGQDFLSAYRDKGKMEQIGKTGVSAMHAALIRYALFHVTNQIEDNISKL